MYQVAVGETCLNCVIHQVFIVYLAAGNCRKNTHLKSEITKRLEMGSRHGSLS